MQIGSQIIDTQLIKGVKIMNKITSMNMMIMIKIMIMSMMCTVAMVLQTAMDTMDIKGYTGVMTGAFRLNTRINLFSSPCLQLILLLY